MELRSSSDLTFHLMRCGDVQPGFSAGMWLAFGIIMP